MSIESLFATEIWRGRLASSAVATRLNRELRRDIKILMGLDKGGWRWSENNYVGGYTSYASVARLHERFAPFMELKRHIDRKVAAYAKSLEWDLQGRPLEMTTCWVNVMPEMVHHSLHLHSLAVISGTYYVSIPSGAGQLRLEDPRLGLFMGAPPRKPKGRARQQNFYRLQPKAGDLVLWESWLRHEVTAHRGKHERISVSFNYEWR